MTTSALAADLGVSEGDVDVLLDQLGEHDPQLPDDLGGFLRRLLDPRGAHRPGRTVLTGSRPGAAANVRAGRAGPDGALGRCSPQIPSGPGEVVPPDVPLDVR
jgi:hypothetical protein